MNLLIFKFKKLKENEKKYDIILKLKNKILSNFQEKIY